ncbi:RhuM family protein [Psychrobacter glacincola]|uniref:RhuM family protein n=1 Tax=Psychrobacter glacincola TaxID=56810 RepID=UPI003D0513A5
MSDLIPYPISEDESVDLSFIDDTIWITQKGMARLFDVDVRTINEHLKNIFDTEELGELATIRKFRIVQKEGNREVERDVSHYNLDAIIALGYRVNSKKATQFRKWATQVLHTYIQDGYVVNEALLRDDPEKLNKLAAKIRELRANEKNVFAQVRECFKISASDYEPSSQEVRSFYALLQDKFHHAITLMTSSKLIMDRAGYKEDNMGLVSFKELFPSKQEAKVGKNYLTKDELYRMYLLSEQFLLFAESAALMRKNLTMKDLQKYLDDLLKFNGYPVFNDYKDYIKDHAMEHAEREHARFVDIKKLEMLGIEVDILEFDSGNYEEYRDQIDAISIQKLRKHHLALQSL